MYMVFIYFSAVPNRFRYHQNAYFRDIVFIFFSAVPNRFRYHQNAWFKEIVYKLFSAVPNRFKYRQNACFRDVVFKIVSEVIRVVSNSVRLHALSCRNVEKTTCLFGWFTFVEITRRLQIVRTCIYLFQYFFIYLGEHVTGTFIT